MYKRQYLRLGHGEDLGGGRSRPSVVSDAFEAVIAALYLDGGMEAAQMCIRDRFNAQQARRELDRLVGYKLSPFLWKKVRRGLSAGRVQSVAVRLIRDRELEIENFKPDEYWNIDALLNPQGEKGEFTARLAATADGKKLTVTNKQQADGILAALDGRDYTITKIEKGKRRRQPSPPFITSTLQPVSYTHLFRGGVKTPPYRAKGKIRIKGNVPGRDKSRPCAQEAKLQ